MGIELRSSRIHLATLTLAALTALASCKSEAPAGGIGKKDGAAGGGHGDGSNGGGNGDGNNGGNGDGNNTGPADSGMACGLVTCQSAHATCGPIGDGCGGVLHCGDCTAPQTCGGGGTPSQCGGHSGCIPRTCAQASANCGPVGDGCGHLLDCGSCNAPDSCGGGGTASVCGHETLPDGALICTPRTCQSVGATCGPIGDGCGSQLDCGSCTAPQTCGGGGMASTCGGHSACVPRTCADYHATCGVVGDGCGATVDCGSCNAPDTCGGAGVANACGQTGQSPNDGGSICVPRSCAELHAQCGMQGDGCGNTIDCGGCNAPDTCGGGGAANQCGHGGGPPPSDAGPVCVPRSCQQLNATCGLQGDGCGNMISCGTCNAPQTCGGGGVHNACGTGGGGPTDSGPICVPRTCQQLGATCGMQGDGCGNVLQCGMCTGGQTCGGGGVHNQCGGMACVPRTCQQAGANCGQVGDGCGNLTASCGNCAPPQICGGGGTPSVCGGGNADAGSCTNLCPRQVTCDGGTTSISGTVYNPAGLARGGDPLYNALVYVPNGTVAPFTPGVSCDRCGAPASGAPLVSTVTGPDGTFLLQNMPTGPNVPLVIQLGRWRRQVVIPNVPACTNTVVDADLTRLPRNKMEGDIPLMAMVTGQVDTLECVLRNIGIDDAEFTVPTANGGSGRVQFFIANGSDAPGGAPNESNLWSTQAAINAYDLVLFACEGAQLDENTTQQNNVINYANIGGRVFATHYSYVWLYNITPWSMTGAWMPDNGVHNPPPDPLTGIIDTSFPKGMAFAQWTVVVGASSGPNQIQIHVSRHDLNQPITAPAQRFIYSDGTVQCGGNPCPDTVQHYAFNTPWGSPPAQQCGRVIFSDFHVNDTRDSSSFTFPNECMSATLSPQEKILEFMLFDLASCIAPDMGPPPMCTPTTCQAQHTTCGPIGDGCGSTIQCGTCTPPQTCGGGGVPGQCGGCTATTCMAQGISCGPAGDGCGNVIQCGNCTAPQTCGGGGTPGVCGFRPPSDGGGACMPTTCSALGISCGPAGDGCGNLLQCGSCTAPQTCGGGGTPGVCGNRPGPDGGGGGCVPSTCMSLGISCGPAGDGCGNVLQCGTCTPPATCGGGGTPFMCGTSGNPGMCVPNTCAGLGLNCGPSGDGCNGTLNCGTCTPPQTCGGGGVSGVCGAPMCTPLTCMQQHLSCGPSGNGCGGMVDCGPCPPGQTCGGGGNGICGVAPDGGACRARTCADQGLQCGPSGDGCGGLLDCGTCPNELTCGGGGTPGVCGRPMCTPTTCMAAGANCGIIGDGCGGQLDCGMCTPPATCGGGGMANVCGIRL